MSPDDRDDRVPTVTDINMTVRDTNVARILSWMEHRITDLEKKVVDLEARPQRVVEYHNGGYNP